MRARLAGLLVPLVLLGTLASAAEPPLVVFKVESLERAADDLEALGKLDGAAGRDGLVSKALELIGVAPGPWIDRRRPAYLLASLPGGALTGQPSWTGHLPVLDVAGALGALGGAAGAEPEDGVHLLAPTDRPPLHAIVGDGGYLTLGKSREAVLGVEPALLDGFDLPAGSLGFDLDLETLVPLVENLWGLQRQAMVQAAEAQAADPAHEADAAPDPTAFLGMADLYSDVFFGVLRGVSHLQLSIERRDGHAVFHARALPVAESELERLIAEQPEGFPRLARALRSSPALLVYAANVKLTEGLNAALLDTMQRYSAVMGELAPALGRMDGGWMQGMLGAQSEMFELGLRCKRGDAAGALDLPDEGGWRGVQLSGVASRDDCEELTETEMRAAAELAGPDGQPLLSVTNPAVMHRGVHAIRTDLRLGSLMGDDPAAAAAVASLFGADNVTSFHGRTDDVTLGVSGADAEADFIETIDRLLDRRKKGGLSPERFAPLDPGAGFYAALDLARLGKLAERFGVGGGPEEQEQEEDEETAGNGGRIVFGARAEEGALALELALPLELLQGRGDDGDPASDPPAELDEQPALLPGQDGVTVPRRVHHVEPAYPELLRVARLEGRVVLQAIVGADGEAEVESTLHCTVTSLDEDRSPEELVADSSLCAAFVDAATEAVEQWRYEPALDDGEPVAVYFTIVVNFELE